MRGREGDVWQRNIAFLPLTEMLKAWSLTGFGGIYIDRFGYADNGTDIVAKFSTLLGDMLLESNDRRLVFFSLEEYNKKIIHGRTEEELSKLQLLAHPLLLSWQSGFSTLEGNSEFNWRWCSAQGELEINNSFSQKRNVTITMGLQTGYEELSTVVIESTTIRVNNQIGNWSGTLTLPPGKSVVRFATDAKQVNAPSDPRVMMFRVINFQMREN
jgi:phosphoglycerol transferase